MAVDAVATIEAARNITVVGLLFLAMVGGYKQWWVYGWLYKAKEAECEKKSLEIAEWKKLALDQMQTVRDAVHVVEKQKR